MTGFDGIGISSFVGRAATDMFDNHVTFFIRLSVEHAMHKSYIVDVEGEFLGLEE
jgi:hypothetical protein